MKYVKSLFYMTYLTALVNLAIARTLLKAKMIDKSCDDKTLAEFFEDSQWLRF